MNEIKAANMPLLEESFKKVDKDKLLDWCSMGDGIAMANDIMGIKTEETEQ